MTLGMMEGPELETFDRIRRIVSVRTKGGGISLAQLGDASALARELESDDPDREKVEHLATRLAIDLEELT